MLGEILWLAGKWSQQALQPQTSTTECCTHVISQQDPGGLGQLEICSDRL